MRDFRRLAKSPRAAICATGELTDRQDTTNMGDPRDLDPLTGMNTSPDQVHYAYDNDGNTIGSFGTRQAATAAEDAYTQKKLGNPPIMGPSPRYGGGGGGLISKIFGWTVFIIVVLVVLFLLALWLFPHGNQ
jgi:hypothetical protein